MIVDQHSVFVTLAFVMALLALIGRYRMLAEWTSWDTAIVSVFGWLAAYCLADGYARGRRK